MILCFVANFGMNAGRRFLYAFRNDNIFIPFLMNMFMNMLSMSIYESNSYKNWIKIMCSLFNGWDDSETIIRYKMDVWLSYVKILWLR